jgi:DNA-binding CsgD family transcriptional regulator/tetratricopeptide (TPR) repeat protein
MLETIREYAVARLIAADEEKEMRARLRDYTVEVAEESMRVGMALVPAPWSAMVDVFSRYDADAGNAREVLSRCLADGDIVTGLRICTAICPCWIARGLFVEGGEWLDELLAAGLSGVPAGVHGPALVGRAQLALASDPGRARRLAAEGLDLCRGAGDQFWTATAVNLLAEVALHAGEAEETLDRAEEALANARQSGDRWNEGYALGSRAAALGLQGDLDAARESAEAALAVMRQIDQRWGAARTLLGLGDLARLRGDIGDARQHYSEALAALREVDAGPKIAHCLAGLGRIAMDQGELAEAREHLAESLQLSVTTGSRIGIARGLSAFAALAVRAGDPGRGVELTAAVTALREAAQLPPVPAARTQRYLDAAAGLGESVVAQLWAHGLSMTGAVAAQLALEGVNVTGSRPGEPGAGATGGAGGGGRVGGAGARANGAGMSMAGGLTTGGSGVAAAAHGRTAGELTSREREVVGLIAKGSSNKAIAEELFISPATAARHVANILAKLGFTSRSQVAAWAMADESGQQHPSR